MEIAATSQDKSPGWRTQIEQSFGEARLPGAISATSSRLGSLMPYVFDSDGAPCSGGLERPGPWQVGHRSPARQGLHGERTGEPIRRPRRGVRACS